MNSGGYKYISDQCPVLLLSSISRAFGHIHNFPQETELAKLSSKYT